MQDKHNGQNGSGTNERLEPTFGDVPNLHNQPSYQGNNQEQPFSAVNFSALDDEQQQNFNGHKPSHAFNNHNGAKDSPSQVFEYAPQSHAKPQDQSPEQLNQQEPEPSVNANDSANNSASAFDKVLGKFKFSSSSQSKEDQAQEQVADNFQAAGHKVEPQANQGTAASTAPGAAPEAAPGVEPGTEAVAADQDWDANQKEIYQQYLDAKERFENSSKVEGNFLYRWRERVQAEKAYRKAQKQARKAGVLPKLGFLQGFINTFRFATYLFIKLGVVGIGVCIILFIYFDAMVIDGYEVDDKWVLPAVVYSRPLELYPDQRLSLDQMIYELKLLQYREVDSPRKPGEYAVNKKTGRVVLIKRPFKFPDGEEPRLSIMIEFEGKRVNRILNAESLQELAFLRMDPVLLDRINRINPQEDRIFVSVDQVPEQLVTTLVEIEDRSYFEHFGINPIAIVRAFVKNTMAGRVVEGGSTITQQLVKNYFLTNERSYSRKLKEIFMAISMNHRYTKEQILEAYMNEIYLGQNGNAGIYGFGLASYFYFGVPIGELSLDQIALLVGLIKGPSYYDPWRYPDNALSRRNTVLAVLRNRGHISPETFETLSQKPLNVIPRGQMNYNKTPAFMGLVKTEIGWRFKEEEEKTGKDFLSGNGIRIFTSFLSSGLTSAEKAVTCTDCGY